MKVEVKNLEKNKSQLHIEVPSETVKQKFNEVYQKISREAKIPGFRPGKAPRDVLEKHHSKFASEEVLKELIPEVYHQALESEKIDAIALPEISDIELKSNILKFKALVETRPEIKLPNYKGIKISHKKVSVTDEDMNKALGDILKLKNAKEADDKLAKGLGYSTIAELKDLLQKQLLVGKQESERQNNEKQLVDYLVNNTDFLVPESLAESRLQELIDDAKHQLLMRGMPKDEVAKRDDELKAKLKDEARTQVKVFLILDEIAKKENIKIDDHTPSATMEFLFKEADWQQTA